MAPRRLPLEQLPAEGPVDAPVGTRLIEVAQADPALLARLRFHLPAASTSDELNERAEAIASEILRLPELPSVVLLHPTATGTRLARRLLLAGARSPVDGGPETLSPRDVVLQAVANEAIGPAGRGVGRGHAPRCAPAWPPPTRRGAARESSSTPCASAGRCCARRASRGSWSS